jgi:proteasome assembly chaperone (PAC2) family protein
MAPPEEPTFLFEPPVGRMTLLGAIGGALLVVALFTIGVVLTDTDPAVIGAAGLVAPFGGAGFGAMMGAVLGGIKAAELEAEERRAARGETTSTDG